MLKNIDEKSINPVWTVPNVPLGPRYSTGFHSRQNPVYTELFTVISKGGGGNSGLINSAGLDRIPVFTEQIGGRFGQNSLYLLNGASYAIFHEHIVNHMRYMVFQFTS